MASAQPQPQPLPEVQAAVALTRQIDQLLVEMRTMGTRIDSIGTTIDNMGTKIDNMGTQMAQMETRLVIRLSALETQMHNGFQQVNMRLTTIDANIQTQTTPVHNFPWHH
jgi:DNA anti-recombination protein RmuC